MTATLIAIRINGHIVNARLCDTPAARHHGMAGATNTSRCACVMIWHHSKTTTTLGATQLHQPYYIFTLATTPTHATSWQLIPLKLRPKKQITVNLTTQQARPRPALIEIPQTLINYLAPPTNVYAADPPPTHIGQLYYPNTRTVIRTIPGQWHGLAIRWHITHHDAQATNKKPKAATPNDPQ